MNASTDQNREYRVDGMSCANCENHVREAVGAVPGVSAAEADAKSGMLRVTGSVLDDSLIAAAVEDAGYEMKT